MIEEKNQGAMELNEDELESVSGGAGRGLTISKVKGVSFTCGNCNSSNNVANKNYGTPNPTLQIATCSCGKKFRIDFNIKVIQKVNIGEDATNIVWN